ncbi:MAG: hypothetical protein JWM86_566 [Thermoleophilia bacterium]|nr:hypothetical protein [Thermoleophilia bacterium]
MLIGTNRAVLGAGAGLLVAGGLTAWAIARGRTDRETSFEHAADAPNRAGSAVPKSAAGAGNLAVAWWPQDISLTQRDHAATLRFQSTIANVGGEPVEIRPGDRVEYTVAHQGRDGSLGEIVARGSAPLDRADVQPFPVPVGVEIGRSIETFGVDLANVHRLEGRSAAIVGAGHASQALEMRDATAGLYVLRQQIVRADGARDGSPADDARLTEFLLDGTGGILHTSSRYAG